MEGQDGFWRFEESQTCPADHGSCPGIGSLSFPPPALACCNAPDPVHNTYQTFDCGGAEWYLGWNFQGDVVAKYVTATGQCWGFWDCACIYEAGTEIASYSPQEEEEFSGSTGRWVVWYNVTSYTTPQSLPCTSGTCQTTGHRENIPNTFDTFEPDNSVPTQQVFEVFDCPPPPPDVLQGRLSPQPRSASGARQPLNITSIPLAGGTR
jgi:hypothetical protein